MKNTIVLNLLNGLAKKLKPKTPRYQKAGLSWLDMKYIKHIPDDQLNKVKLLGREINVFGRIGFMDALQEIFFAETYKISLVDAPYIIDCGANIGLSVIYLKNRFPKAKIVAFEPDTMNFELLQHNVEAFHFDNVELRKEAVWSENTVLNFSNNGTMSSRIAQDGTHRVKAVRLADFLTQRVDFLKIDIEGAEHTVLTDIRDCLQNVQNIFVEYHGTFGQNRELVDILEIMNTSGFMFYIKEAAPIYQQPFTLLRPSHVPYDLQLNIFGMRRKP